MKLANQVSVVTGAGRGIGREIALTHAREGARVALLARTVSEVEKLASEINAAGGTARAHVVDVIDLDAVTAVFAAIRKDLGPITVLVNNAAAFGAIGPIWDVDPAVWWRDVETNVRGTFNCCRAVLPSMRERRQGRIINLTGGGTFSSFPHGSGYATSKSGILRFTESVGDSLHGSGVLLFAMDPGLVRTSMTAYQLESAAGQKYLPNIESLFERGINVPPTRAAELSVEIARGRFDKLAGRMLMAARGDIDLTEAAVDEIVAGDLRSLRVNGLPPEGHGNR
jgi:NAD(P)-dependent dehydrogenase (short-subunit alcohol dehydrogenase family)